MVPFLEVKLTANPMMAGPSPLAQRLVITVKLATAIAHHRAAIRHCVNYTPGINAILEWHG
jgi:hypothetical protein